MSVTSLTGNGLKDWLIQRISAVYLLIYVLGMMAYLGCHSPLEFSQWSGLFQMPTIQIATILAFFMLIWHAWIGIWTVLTDYVTCTALRLSLQVLFFLYLSAQLIWGIMVVSNKGLLLF
ncbi:MAG TPA: succinate dehydrogenase, hydrophobic membrane anchor protein [Legionellaceae bacterium]|nr:succinate dehydrogenase, hydrophobic membrane anchor protein [Legionellaceae bacterium]